MHVLCGIPSAAPVLRAGVGPPSVAMGLEVPGVVAGAGLSSSVVHGIEWVYISGRGVCKRAGQGIAAGIAEVGLASTEGEGTGVCVCVVKCCCCGFVPVFGACSSILVVAGLVVVARAPVRPAVAVAPLPHDHAHLE